MLITTITMASFVREVLSATGRLGEKEDYAGKAARLRSSIDDLKSGLSERIEARYTDFSASFAEVSQQIAQLEEVMRETEDLENSIQRHLKPGLAEASRESVEILNQIKELSASASAANKIREVYETLESANELIGQKQYTEATKKLRQVEDAINVPFSVDQDIIKTFQSIKLELQTSQERVRHVLCNEWDQLVRINPDQNSDPANGVRSISIGSTDGKPMLESLVLAMHATDTLSYRINKFGAKLITEIVGPVLQQRVVSIETVENQHHLLVLRLEPQKSDPRDVLDILKRVFQFIGESFDLRLTDTGDKTLMECLGDGFGSKLNDLLIKECLGPAVPTSKEDLANYDAVISATESLQSVLVESKFLPPDPTILKYAQNVNSTFANKRCQMLLVKGRELMKEDLHLSVTVDRLPEVVQKDLENTLFIESIDPSVEEDMLPLPRGMSLDKSVFTFPKCQVSQSVFKLMEMVKETLEEACSEDATPFFSGRLLVTARNLIEMYCDVVPVFHCESLRNFPQLSALSYNNCFYLAHECLTLGLLYSDRLRGPFNTRAITFADLVPRLRQTGIEIFLEQMRRQRDELKSILKDSSTGFGQLTGSELLPAKSEKCIRQVLHQLHHLRKLWQDVLPPNIYCKSIGTIMNTVVDDLIQRVLVLEDIAADAATQICSLFGTLQDKGPDVFVLDGQPDSSRGDVIRYVRRWNKFREIILVLNASLREIDDRWAGGKGPLAAEFSPEEVKRLIRALFQNTDRRATVLARIKFES